MHEKYPRRLGIDDAAIIDAFFIEYYGIGLTQLDIFKRTLKTLPCDEQVNHETSFLTKSTESNKTIIGLKTPEYQIGIFDQIAQDVQLEELVNTLKEKTGTADFDKLTEIYLKENIEGFLK